ncbi:MAG TPA: response regulator [Ktedonobacteraceae bacterium]|nr:response regulator [Ktedonobacteraceae bacterium]
MMKQQGAASIREVGERKTILIVEDDSDTGLVLVSALEQYTLLSPLLVPNASEALRVVRERKPDLFLLDYWLGGIDGIELAEQLHRVRGLETVPTIVMSAATLPFEWEEQPDTHRLALLRKPFDLDVLFETIAALLAGKHLA